jgi:hypothetical protein
LRGALLAAHGSQALVNLPFASQPSVLFLSNDASPVLSCASGRYAGLTSTGLGLLALPHPVGQAHLRGRCSTSCCEHVSTAGCSRSLYCPSALNGIVTVMQELGVFSKCCGNTEIKGKSTENTGE